MNTGVFKDAEEGVVHFRSGEVCHLEVRYEGDQIYLRYESGWYCRYRPDGTRIAAGRTDGTSEIFLGSNSRDVVRFEPMSWSEAKSKYVGLASECTP